MDGNNSGNGNGLEKSSLSLYTQLPETVHKSAGIETDVWRSSWFIHSLEEPMATKVDR